MDEDNKTFVASGKCTICGNLIKDEAEAYWTSSGTCCVMEGMCYPTDNMEYHTNACESCGTVNCEDRKDDVVACIGDYQPGTPLDHTKFVVENEVMG